MIYEIQAEQSAPVPWAEASIGIKAHLIKVRSADALKAEVQRLREATKIEKNALPAEDAK